MPVPGGVSNDVLAERIASVKDDVAELAKEMERARKRLHAVEGNTDALLSDLRQRRESVGRNQRRLELRLQVLTAVVAGAALFEPFLYHIATGR